MSNRIGLARVGIVALTLAAASAANAQLFGVAGFEGFSAQSLYSIDAATGQATFIGNTGLTDVVDIAYAPLEDRLFAVTLGGDIYQLNRATGAATLAVDAADLIPEGGLAINPSTGIAFTTIFDDLYRLVGNSWQLIGASGLSVTDVSGLAFVNGELLGYATDGSGADTLVRFDPLTGAATVRGPLGIESSDSVAGLAFDFAGTGTLFATDGDRLLTVDPATGSASIVGSHGVSGFVGIAAIPTPGALALLGMGSLLATRRRR